MTARSVLDGMKARLSAATPGPWGAYAGCIRQERPWSEASEVVVDYDSIRPTIPDATFIAAAPTDVARLVAAVEGVLGLHKPEKRWMPYDGAGVSYDTEREAIEAMDGVDLGSVAIEEIAENGTPFFEVCAHCKRIEDAPCEGECTLEAGYRESLWPCPAAAAIENALEAGK